MEKLQVRNPLYPLISLIASMIVFVIGILFSQDIAIFYLLLALTLIYALFGYVRPLSKILPVFILISIIIGFGSFITSRDFLVGVQTSGRIILLAYSSVLMIALPPINLTRNLVQLNFPKVLTLGMLATIRFVPVLINETIQIKEAMSSRGVKFSWFNIKCIYRAFLVPFLMRIINMSDILAISIETRGFTLSSNQSSVYKQVKITKRDIFFSIMLISSLLGVTILWIN